MNVAEYVRRSAATVSPSDTIEHAARLMADHAVGTLVVVDGDTPTGIVTDRDIVLRAIAKRRPLDSRVDSIMSMNLVIVDARADVRDVVRAFSHHAVRRLVVLEHGRVVGVVSVDDVLIVLANEFGEAVKGVTAQMMFPHAADEPPPLALADHGL